MTSKLSIKCPYKTETNEIRDRILMFVYFRETDGDGKIQDAARIKAKNRVQRIRAVEIFSELLDEADETNAVKISKTESLFLITSEDESSIVDIENAHPDPHENWKIHLFDAPGSVFQFRASLKLKTQNRCSLLPSDEDCVDLDFELKKPAGALTFQNKLDCLKKLSLNYGELEIENNMLRVRSEIFIRKLIKLRKTCHFAAAFTKI